MLKEVNINGVWFFFDGENYYPEYLNRGNAFRFIEHLALTWCIGDGLDIGVGSSWLEGATPIHHGQDENALKLDKYPDGSQDFVFSSHCLEHIVEWQDALTLWIKKLKKEGVLFLYLPHESMELWNPGGEWCGDHHKWIPKTKILVPWLKKNGVKVLRYSDHFDAYWSFYVIGKKA